MVAGALVVGYSVRVLGGRWVTVYVIPLLVIFYGLLTRGLTEPRYLGLMLATGSVVLVALFMWRFSRRKQPVVAQAAPGEKAKPATPEETRPSAHAGAPTGTSHTKRIDLSSEYSAK